MAAETVFMPKADWQAALDATRAKGGTSALLTSAELAPAIKAIQTGGGGLTLDIGEFVVSEDITKGPKVPHNLGAAPDFIMVWTDAFAFDVAAKDKTYCAFSLFMRDICGLPQQFSSANVGPGYSNHGVVLQVGGGITINKINSVAYGWQPQDQSDTAIKLPIIARDTYWKSGITYHYAVAKGWWLK